MSAARPLRAWQAAAWQTYQERSPQDFLAVATPGAGKTTFACHVARELFKSGEIDQMVVVAPTEHLKRQWADSAHAMGLPIDPEFSNTVGSTTPDFLGIAVTYAQVGMAPELHERGVSTARTFVILDEVHHAGDNLTWGDAVRKAYGPAVRRLSLSGTPFRSDINPIAFVHYERDDEGVLRSVPDYTYGYGRALSDGVVRPVVFLAYSGETRWRNAAGEELSARLGDPMTVQQTAHAWRTALDPKGNWMPQVLAGADRRLSQVRADGMPDAGGLVIASNQTAARAYAKLLREVCGQMPTVVLSDDPKASDKIAEFSASDQRWLVAVRMVSEGVDVPRLAVGVYATSASTPLYFSQVVGRFVRARRPGETASLFVPSVPPLLRLAANLEAERDHALARKAPEEGTGLLDDSLLEAANRRGNTADVEAFAFEALEAEAELDKVIYGGDEFGGPAGVGTQLEEQYLTLPGMADARDVAGLLAARQASHLAAPAPVATMEVPLHRQVSNARRELNRMVGHLSHRTGSTHAQIHVALRRECGGPPTAQATLEELQARIAVISRW